MKSVTALLVGLNSMQTGSAHVKDVHDVPSNCGRRLQKRRPKRLRQSDVSPSK